jgi:isopenicillin-N epimerase
MDSQPFSQRGALPLPELAAHFLLRRDVTFLNHGSFGACPRPVFDVYQEWQHELEREPVDFLSRRIGGLMADARARLADYLQTEVGNLVFVPNATFGVNIVARSLDLQAGDEVLSTNHEYGAADRAWRFNCARRGVTYINQPIGLPLTTSDAIVEQLWAGVTARTRVIFLSHITSPTAVMFPVADVCQRAREQGILTLVDGAHAPGQIDLALDAVGADFYAGNCHKWLCAPKGAGFLYARPEVQHLLQPLVVSHGWQSANPGVSTFMDYFDWTGTHDPAAYLSVPAAIDFQRENDWPSVRAACHDLAGAIRERVAALTGLPPICDDSTAWWNQMCAMPLPSCDIPDLRRRLWEEWQIEMPLFAWEGRPLARVSIQAYNSPADGDRLLEALAALL